MDAMMNDLQRAAARARPALAVLSTELGEPSPDAARALVVLGQMLDDIEVGRQARSDALTVALDDIGCLIELASDRG